MLRLKANGMSANGALADWQLAAFAVVTGNGTNWMGTGHRLKGAVAVYVAIERITKWLSSSIQTQPPSGVMRIFHREASGKNKKPTLSLKARTMLALRLQVSSGPAAPS